MEFTRVGQAFRLGRYPIHFHLNGWVTKSYVKQNSLHKTYNRYPSIQNQSDLNTVKLVQVRGKIIRRFLRNYTVCSYYVFPLLISNAEYCISINKYCDILL